MNDKPNRSRGLGRGLSSLMSDVAQDNTPDQSDSPPASPDLKVAIEKIEPNPNQPRRSFDQSALDELSASIAERGIIQPLIVRPSPTQTGSYEIVAGERRWRAAQMGPSA